MAFIRLHVAFGTGFGNHNSALDLGMIRELVAALYTAVHLAAKFHAARIWSAARWN